MWQPPRFLRTATPSRFLACVALLAALLALPGCAVLDQALPENPPDTAEQILGDVESRLGAVARATSRASRAGSLEFAEVLEIREQIAEVRRIANEARELLAAGQPGEAVSTVDRAEVLLNVLQRRL